MKKRAWITAVAAGALMLGGCGQSEAEGDPIKDALGTGKGIADLGVCGEII